ncbi:MAG: GPP34 family phosphoprotein [Gammaproteobacteria bacterium]|nr:GPP34 family phosphoprotein [Gammaproteobacteria bacterium]
MLTFTEEILLLLLGEEDGAFLPVNSNAFECALAGATLMDLAFALRIDTDLESLIVLNENPTGLAMLDRILARIAAHPKVMDAQSWVRLLAREEANTIREQALASLVDRGILEQRETRRVEHYPLRDGTAQREIKLHIREVVLADDIPDPRDVVRIALCDACSIFPEVLSDREIEQATPRIRQLRVMDLIGREVAGAIAAIQRTMLMAVRARLARFRKYVLALAAIGGIATLATVLVPRIPVPDRFGPTLLERLWGDGAWQEWSGYVLLALSVLGFAAASVRRMRFAAKMGDQNWWRVMHVGLGMSCVLLLFVHTGFRLGYNLNAVLMGCYLAALISGAFAGVLMGGATQLRRFGFAQVGKLTRLPMRVHVIALCTLPALLVIHLLIVYLY